MSWFAGCYNDDSMIIQSIELAIGGYDKKLLKKHLLLYADDNNTIIKSDENSLEIICGNVIKKAGYKWLFSTESYIPLEERSKRAGHFIGLRYADNSIEFYNDTFGLRELYYYFNEQNTLFFSTRMDILLKLRNENVMNWRDFGSYWLLKDPLGQGYFIEGIKRLNQAGRITIKGKELKKENELWTAPGEMKYDKKQEEEVISEISSLMTLCAASGEYLHLALSGGYDSRALLALLLKKEVEIIASTWGSKKNPDVQIASLISRDAGLVHKIYEDELSGTDGGWESFYDYCGRNQLVTHGTAVFEQYHYNELDKRYILIDGGAGELIRRCLNANLEYRGSNYIKNGNIRGIIELLKYKKADIFSCEQLQIMHEGVLERAQEAYDAMPALKETGLGNWIETWNVRQRIGNISSRSQQILDDAIKNFMPYLQRRVVESAMKVPAKLRATNYLLEEIIRIYAPELAKYLTVRNGMPMRYGTGRIGGKLKALIYRKKSHHNESLARFLQKHRERIREIALQSYQLSIYDRARLDRLVKDYYDRGQRESELVWWLSFECYRRQFGISI